MGRAVYVRFTPLPVADQDRAIAFYTEALGFRVAEDRAYQDGWRWITLEIPGAQTKIFLSRKPRGQSADGVPSLVLTVEDVFEKHRELKERGVVFTQEPTRAPWDEREVFAVLRDSEGNLVMLGTESREESR